MVVWRAPVVQAGPQRGRCALAAGLGTRQRHVEADGTAQHDPVPLARDR